MAPRWVLSQEQRISDRRVRLEYVLHGALRRSLLVNQRELTPERLQQLGEHLADTTTKPTRARRAFG